jgi:hypothetical protein
MMNKISTSKIAIGVLLLFFLEASLVIPGGFDDIDIIKERLMSLGFLENTIETQRDGSCSIKVSAYAQRSQALSLAGAFSPFEVRAKYSRGVLYLEKTDIEKAGFTVDETYLPGGVKIERMGVTTRSLQIQKTVMDPNIQRIEQALEETKRKQKRVHSSSRGVTDKANRSFAGEFPDVCKTPSEPGPIPIPYPNVSSSSETAKDSKAAKADKAAAIAKDSDLKMPESDEVSTRMTKLQKAYEKIVAKRELSDNEKADFKRELQTCLDKAALLKKTLDVYVEEIEKLLQQAKE